MAGVVIPVLAVLGLMAIPYLDSSPKACGYYTIGERPVALGVFLFGFLQLWVLLILAATFFRGPDWGFFGPYQPREPHASGGPGRREAVQGRLGQRRRPASSGGSRLGWRCWASTSWSCRWSWAGRCCGPLRNRLGGGRYWLMVLL